MKMAQLPQRPWIVLALLLLAVLVPTLCALWLLLEGVESERLAVYERLRQAYTPEAEVAVAEVDAWLDTLAKRVEEESPGTAAEFFAWTIKEHVADAGFLCSPETGLLLYPREETSILPAAPVSRAWQEAERLEYQARDKAAAAVAYEKIAASTEGAERMLALLAQARTLEQPPAMEESLRLLRQHFTLAVVNRAMDSGEKALALNGLYRIHQLARLP